MLQLLSADSFFSCQVLSAASPVRLSRGSVSSYLRRFCSSHSSTAIQRCSCRMGRCLGHWHLGTQTALQEGWGLSQVAVQALPHCSHTSPVGQTEKTVTPKTMLPDSVNCKRSPPTNTESVCDAISKKWKFVSCQGAVSIIGSLILQTTTFRPKDTSLGRPTWRPKLGTMVCQLGLFVQFVEC